MNKRQTKKRNKKLAAAILGTEGVDHYWIRLKKGHKFPDGSDSLFVSEGTMRKIATLIAI